MKDHWTRKLLQSFLLKLFAVASLFSLPVLVPAAPGDLDPTFSGDGKLLDLLSRADDFANGVAIQLDGKVVVAGSSRGDFAVVRYNTDGSLDTTFGTGGRVTTDINFSYDAAFAVAIQQDGKIVAAGASDTGFALVRYNSNGSLDPSFGTNGKVTTDINSRAYSVAIQADGKIVAAGGNAIARYNADGTLDPTFDSDGVVTMAFPSLSISLYAVAIQADGKIIAAGQSYSQPTQSVYFAIVRYGVDGSLDTSFDGGLVTNQVGPVAYSLAIQTDGRIVAAGPGGGGFGLVRYTSNGTVENAITVPLASPYSDVARSVALQPDGKIVAAGVSFNGFNEIFALIRLNANFSLDTTFGVGGRMRTTFGSDARGRGVAVRTDGKIVAVGENYSTDSYDFAAARYNANGSPDTSFDGDGRLTTDLGLAFANVLHDAVVQPDGKIVAAGAVRGDFAVLRYNADGTPDTAFGAGTGKVRTAMGSRDGARAVAIQTDGKVVVAGGSVNFEGDECCFTLARYNVDGSLDTTFDADGIVITGSYETYTGAYDVAIQPDGKIVAAGYDAVSNGSFAVYRYNTDGSLDTSFGGDGTVITPILQYASAKSVLIQPDGKIVAAGTTTVNSYDYVFAVVRYNGDGSLDSSFGTGGIVTTSPSVNNGVSSAVLQPDGKIIVAGSRSINSNDTGFALIRYNENGSLDTTFGVGGIVTTDVGLKSAAHAVALQSNGKIVASGTSSGAGNTGDFAVVRYNSDGSLDAAFGGGDGIATVDFDNSTDNANGLALDNAGRAVVVGESDGSFALARFHLAPSRASFDFDGDGRSDISVFRPSSAVWYIDRSTNGLSATQFGLSTDKITPTDIDGDGRGDISVYRDGIWYWINSSNNQFNAVQFGLTNDRPVPADFTGDGRAELAVYRNGVWWTFDLVKKQAGTIQFGLPTDKPIPADYDGDGRTDQAVYRDGVWHLNRSSQGYAAVQFGLATDKPVAGDYDGDCRADLAVYRDGRWYVLQSNDGFAVVQFGLATDVPVPADYDGDGKTDVAVFRNGTWYLLRSTSGVAIQDFGLAGDKPLQSAFLP